MEACATSHFWGRFAEGLGHEVRLIPPIYVKAVREAAEERRRGCCCHRGSGIASEPTLRRGEERRAPGAPPSLSEPISPSSVQRTQLIKALRGHLAEFGLVVAQGPASLKAVVGMIDDDTVDLPGAVRDVVRLYLDQIALLTQKIDELHLKLRVATKVDDAMRRLCTVPGVGPVTAGAIMAFAPDLRTFASGTKLRCLAWPGSATAIDWGQDPPGFGQQDGAGRYSQAPDRRCHEQDPLDRAQGDVARQLAGPRVGSQAPDGSRRCAGQQNDAHDLGDDDAGKKITGWRERIAFNQSDTVSAWGL